LWRWEEFLALAAQEVTVDIHCVTKWSKLDTSWRGVPVETLLKTVETEAEPGFWETYGYYNHGDPWLEQRYQGD
jgi:DMSO/TMAO reductase YedYZ molybdopterin-dependent catalytic subunit